jgi:regulator of PEP synthase PpsR (kinase-PPPase family)
MGSSKQVSYFHLHLVSDATGETLLAIGRAATARYARLKAIEHIHSGVRSPADLARVLMEIETMPGIVLHTMVNTKLVEDLDRRCKAISAPCVAVLDPVMNVFDAYLGERQSPQIGRQHTLDAEYFRRIEAVNFTIAHDDGQNIEGLPLADIILVGVSRTSKTPTSIYLGYRGYKTANVPIVAELPLPAIFSELQGVFVVGLVASPDRISIVRGKRAQTMHGTDLGGYVDRETIAREINITRQLCARNRWPLIDVTRRSIEETAAAILELYNRRST